ncbi:prolipoprotein diacylglyceryl transferase [Streptococcus varani]|uniref:Phosphatidylglycerol--prolipoprotein diacylglyceryl transferase n=1 Tax=Streptococcus varani TaxID=1608583 RepID=A0A0E4CTF3_9STRE|nr:prolipoprotein diacylglyceryl transferase [Streptococcus varani]CQR25651.1 prolipoprotein diacylglyceryl transferase [Streptococcus varani]
MIDPIALQFGPIEIRWYALMIISGLLLAVYLSAKEAPRKKIRSDDVYDFILYAFPLAIIGARIYYVIFSWYQYKNGSFMNMIAIWNGGIAIYGGLIAGFLFLIFFTRHRFIETWDFLDIAAPSVMIAQSIGRWGNFFNQEAYGGKVGNLDFLPGFIRDQMYIDGAYRQPTFLYESVWNLIGFALILLLRRKPKLLKQGEITLFYIVWYGLGRFFIEGMRTDSLFLAGLRVSQWLSLVLVITGFVLFLFRRKKQDLAYYQS